ncbi:MAG: SRPBCC family protein [Candidatus Omnitrophota bacterium]|jgi:uncharacterized membrane protein
MPIIQVSTTIKSKREEVYELLKKPEDLPKFIKNVKRIQIEDRDVRRAVVHWEVLVDGALVIWKEEQIFDDVSFTMRFKMLEGDYNKYEGEWELQRVLNGTKIILSVNIDWGMPSFVAFPEVKKILMTKTKTSLKAMLIALKKRAERSI